MVRAASELTNDMEQLTFLARGCGTHVVLLCPGLHGFDAFHELRALSQNSLDLYYYMRFPTILTNSIAHGMMALEWGGLDHVRLPHYRLSCANFKAAALEDMDRHRPAADFELEPRPEHAQDPQQWFQDATRECWAWALYYGQEYFTHQVEAARMLLRMHTNSERAWPAHIIFGIWAELRGQWREELRAIYRQVLDALGGKEPARESIRTLCTAPRGPDDPAPWLQLPRTFDLTDPCRYFARVVRPRRWIELGRPGQCQISPRIPAPSDERADPVEDLKQLIRSFADAILEATEDATRREQEQRAELAELRRRREEISARCRELMPRVRDVQWRIAAVRLRRAALEREAEANGEVQAARPEPPPGLAAEEEEADGSGQAAARARR